MGCLLPKMEIGGQQMTLADVRNMQHMKVELHVTRTRSKIAANADAVWNTVINGDFWANWFADPASTLAYAGNNPRPAGRPHHLQTGDILRGSGGGHGNHVHPIAVDEQKRVMTLSNFSSVQSGGMQISSNSVAGTWTIAVLPSDYAFDAQRDGNFLEATNEQILASDPKADLNPKEWCWLFVHASIPAMGGMGQVGGLAALQQQMDMQYAGALLGMGMRLNMCQRNQSAATAAAAPATAAAPAMAAAPAPVASAPAAEMNAAPPAVSQV